jgi:hypothetical protein
LKNVPAAVHGRVLQDRYQWPGLYFEIQFNGRSVYFRTGAGDVILHALVDGESVGTLVKPARGLYLVDGLSNGRHTVRIEAITESQAGPNEFDGFALASGSKSSPMTPRDRQIEFIGDSHTVGYGDTSPSRDCTSDQVWATTDSSQAFGPKVAKHYGADYQINAISGRGIVRNYNGSPGDPLPAAYPFALFEHSARYADNGWHPQIIVIALGTNDFSKRYTRTTKQPTSSSSKACAPGTRRPSSSCGRPTWPNMRSSSRLTRLPSRCRREATGGLLSFRSMPWR